MLDPVTGETVEVLWVKGSGGDLGTIQRDGFATLYMDRLNALKRQYRGVEHEDEIVERYPLCTFGNNPRAASIDTPLHAFLPFKHVDHLHPDWAIALAAARTGRACWKNFMKRRAFGSSGCPGSVPALSSGSGWSAPPARIRTPTESCSARTGCSPGAIPGARAT